jgi:hypothetical protein
MTIEVAELRHSRTLILPMSRGVIEAKRSASDCRRRAASAMVER